MIALIFACAAPLPEPSLGSPDVEVRVDAFVHLDVAGMNREADLLLEMTRSEPDDWLRRESIRQLGVVDDPRVLPRLLELADGPHRSEALESMGYAGPAGCAAFAEQWLAADAAQFDTFWPVARFHPQCLPAFQERCGRDPWHMMTLMGQACVGYRPEGGSGP